MSWLSKLADTQICLHSCIYISHLFLGIKNYSFPNKINHLVHKVDGVCSVCSKKIKFTLEQAIKALKGSTGIALLFL